MKEKSQGIVKGALFLTVAGLLVKVIGMIYKIPLTNRLGDDGMGYFNAAYTVYTLFFVLSSSGLPTALSLSVAKDLATKGEAEARTRYHVTARFCALLGLVLSLILFLFAKPLAWLLGSIKAYLAIVSVAPALFFVTAASAMRGYYQGRGNMLPTALSQLCEALGKLVFGLLLISLALSYGFSKEKVAAYAILGLSFSTFLTYVLLLFFCRSHKSEAHGVSSHQKRALLYDTLKSAFPITASALAASLAASLDLALLMRSLQSIGYTPDAANAAWGNYSSLVLPLFHMPQVLLTPIAYAVLPALRAALAKGENEKGESLVQSALTVTALLSALSALGLSLFSRDALMLLYTDEAAIAHAYPHLALLAIAIFPFGVMTVSASLLQAYGRLWFPMLSLAAGAILKIFVTLFGVSFFGEAVAPIGTLVAYTLSGAINTAALLGLMKRNILSKITLKPLVIAALSVGASLLFKVFLSSRGMEGRLSTLVSIAMAGGIAIALIFLIGAIKKEDLVALGIHTNRE